MYFRPDERDAVPSWGYVWMDERQVTVRAHARLKQAFDWAFAQADSPYGANLWLAADSHLGAEFYLSPESMPLWRRLAPNYRIRNCDAPVRPLIYVAGFRHVGPTRAQVELNRPIKNASSPPIEKVVALIPDAAATSPRADADRRFDNPHG